MQESLKRLRVAVSSLWLIHLGIPNTLAFIVIFSLIYHFVGNEFLTFWLTNISESYDGTSIYHNLLLGIISSFIAALVFGLIGVFLLDWYSKIKLTGRFRAYVVEDNELETEWGTVTMKYYPLSSSSHHTSVKLVLKHDDIVLHGDAIIIDNRFLAGHYAEIGNPQRRRSGSFMYELDGTGNIWQGDFICIAPDAATPSCGTAKWVRI